MLFVLGCTLRARVEKFIVQAHLGAECLRYGLVFTCAPLALKSVWGADLQHFVFKLIMCLDRVLGNRESFW